MTFPSIDLDYAQHDHNSVTSGLSNCAVHNSLLLQIIRKGNRNIVDMIKLKNKTQNSKTLSTLHCVYHTFHTVMIILINPHDKNTLTLPAPSDITSYIEYTTYIHL